LSSVPGFLPPDPRVEEPYRVTPQTAIRIAVIGVIAIALFAALVFRLWALQVISGERYLQTAENNQVRTFRVPAPRGAISDRNGVPLVSNRPGTLVQIWPAALEGMAPERRAAMLERLGEILNVRVGEIRKQLKAHRNDPLTPVTVREAVRDDKVRYLLEHQAQFPGVDISEVELRRYPQGNLAAQILGNVGEISAEQLKQLEDKGYAAGDRIGQVGIESAFDRYLRGVAGVGEVRVDAMGRVTSERTFSRFPEPGYSVRLTIDANLQRAAEKALKYGVALAQDNGEWAADGGAIVAMDPNDGQILALASSPTFDPSVYVGRVRPQALKRLAAPEANYPTLNRAVAGLYPPGSTFKPVTALAAIQEGILTPSEIIQCTGSIKAGEDEQVFRNWDPTKNEPMTLTTALANSCDTYFYQVALEAYERPDSPIQKWARQMGFGQETGLDVGPEGEGLVPTPAWRKRHFESAWDQQWRPGDSIQLGIGQGDMLATPLQMTRFYALLANGGKLVQPRIVEQIEQPATEGDAAIVVRNFPGTKPEDVGLDQSALSTVQEGLYDATHAPYGTSTSVFSHFPVPIAGKTGTAEKYVTIGDWSGLRDQSWWCGWGPYADPELVVCSLIENGGHGGEAAAPAALKVFEQFFGVEPGSYVSGAVQSD
jgi:penicillin-binding protein 2